MTRHLGDFASTVQHAVAPASAYVAHAAPKLTIASLRWLQSQGLPWEAAVAAFALACALVVFLAIAFVFRAAGSLGRALGRGAGAASDKVHRIAASLGDRKPGSLSRRSREAEPAPQVRHGYEPAPAWDPAVSAVAVPPAGPAPLAAASAIPATTSRPTPASVEAGAFGAVPQQPHSLEQEEVPPGFLYVDTSPAQVASAPPPAATVQVTAATPPAEAATAPLPQTTAPAAADTGILPAPIPFTAAAPAPGGEAVALSELEEARERRARALAGSPPAQDGVPPRDEAGRSSRRRR
jgi:hypothetical protein